MSRDVVTTYAAAIARSEELERENAALRAELAAQEREPLTVPDGLARSDAEFWLTHRAQIIQACIEQGFTIVTTAYGVHLMRLGNIKANSITTEPRHG